MAKSTSSVVKTTLVSISTKSNYKADNISLYFLNYHSYLKTYPFSFPKFAFISNICYNRNEVKQMTLLAIIYVLIFIIFALAAYAVMQIKLAGIEVKDFWSFIEANQILDKLYEFSKKYETLTPQQKVVYLMEAEKVFTAFDKIPNIIWEDEFKKYDEVLKKYKEIRIERWSSN